MDATRWRRVREIVETAFYLPAPDRERFLQEQCGGDDPLRVEVDRLLRADACDDDYLRPPAPADLDGMLGTEEDLEPGTRVGAYVIRELLATGGMGRVYLGERADLQFDKAVAIKLIKRGMDSQEILRRFRNERQVLARLEHPGIARLIDGGALDDGRPFLVMEYVPGELLDRYCDGRRLGLDERLRLFCRVCEAVHAAHQSLIVHRDLKPGNILVTATGEPKLLDFGIAKLLGPEGFADESLRTRGISQRLTPEYASPEQVRGEPVTTASDIYSLGVVLFELLTGSRPYHLHTDSRAEVDRVICEEEPRRPSTAVVAAGSETGSAVTTELDERARRRRSTPHGLRGRLRGDLDNIVLKALQKHTQRRYASAEQLAEDVQRHLDGLPVRARPDTWAYRTGKFVRRNKLLVGAAALVVLSLALGLVAALRFGLLAVRARQDAVNAKAESDRQLGDVLRFSDAILLGELEAGERELWPSRAHRIPAMQEWLRDARQAMQRREAHQDVRRRIVQEVREQQVRAGWIPSGAAVAIDWERADSRQRWKLRTSEGVLAGLERLGSLIDDVEGRLADAGTIRVRSIDDHEEAWDDATTEIYLSDRYDELELTPQVGLVPLGPDPDSALWEFWHVASGTRPERDLTTEQLQLVDGNGVVLILVPGGTFRMGAQSGDPDAANHDPQAMSWESPVHEVTLAPFFIAKYELNQSQWTHLGGSNPSYSVEPLRPVDSVSWNDCREMLRRLDLRLPTEAQWEFAARAGVGAPWSCGARENLRETANVSDRTFARASGIQTRPLEEWDDGHNNTAPVGSFRPNRFGLHDTSGNVFEWCQDQLLAYTLEVRGEDGLRIGDPDPAAVTWRVLRGGSYYDSSLFARSAYRNQGQEASRTTAYGVRPVREIE